MDIHFYVTHFPLSPATVERQGVTKAVHGLASGLATAGAVVTVLCEGLRDESVETSTGYRLRCFRTHKPIRPSFTLAPALVDYVRDNLSPDTLVVLNGMFHPNVYSLSRLLRRLGVPYVIAPQDPYHPSVFRTNRHLKWPYWFLYERPMLRRAAGIQILDARHGAWLRRLGVHTPVIAVPSGFSPSDVHPESALSWRTEGAPLLYFLGRIDTYNKGLDLLLDAFALCRDATGARLAIQGEPSRDRERLRRKADRLSLARAVSFLEPDYQTSAALLMARHDVFCLPSRFEGFGLVALEAMLAGRVLLVSDVAGMAPHVQASQSGVIVAPEVSAIRIGLIDLIRQRPAWEEMGRRGRRWALEHLHWDTIAPMALDHYRQLLRRP